MKKQTEVQLNEDIIGMGLDYKKNMEQFREYKKKNGKKQNGVSQKSGAQG